MPAAIETCSQHVGRRRRRRPLGKVMCHRRVKSKDQDSCFHRLGLKEVAKKNSFEKPRNSFNKLLTSFCFSNQLFTRVCVAGSTNQRAEFSVKKQQEAAAGLSLSKVAKHK